MMTATLCELNPGEWARVTAIQTTGCAHQRMLMMGLLPGTILRHLHVAPFGDPIAVEFEGRRLCLRRKEAAAIDVERLASRPDHRAEACPQDLTGELLP